MVAVRLRDPRQLRLVFMATMAVLLVTLGCLTWWLIDQDRRLASQRQFEQRESAADLAVASLERHLLTAERRLGELVASGDGQGPMDLPAGAVLVRWSSATVRAWPDGRLLYHPDMPTSSGPPAGVFAEPDYLEFRARDYPAAVEALAKFTTSADAGLRAEALARTARVQVKQGDDRRALETYGRLTAVGAAAVAGIPSALAGRLGALGVYERQRNAAGVERTAADLARELDLGRWPIGAATYAFVAQELSRVGHDGVESDGRLALASVIDRLWMEHQGRAWVPSGRGSFKTGDGAVLAVWRSQGATTAVFAASAAFLEREWIRGTPGGIALIDADGQVVAGPETHQGAASVRLSSATGLPWTVQSVGAPGDATALGTRRILLVSSLTVVFLLVVIGAGFIGRSVARELAVARLQSDFVSTVSHELRTPLTALCQLSELLARGRVASDEDRQAYYRHLYAESDRLRRLVEGLLDFSRLEAGRNEFQFERVDPAAVVRQSAADFAVAQPGRHRLEVADAPTPLVHADPDALRCALWNLFENAIKYSPDADVVRIEVASRGRHVEIAVTDRGVGIPRAEQRRIFDRFVRGSAAHDRGIRGTGIGLAMVRQIVRAHGGRVTVESEPGQGSTFRVFLPMEKSA